LVIGSLLGDATLLRTTSGWCFRVHHGLAQRTLVNWKHELLSEYVRTGPRESGPGIYFRTVTHPAFGELREQFYAGAKKIVPLDLIERELDEFGVAVWTMDDGAIDGNQVRINTQSFSVEEVEALARVLRAKFGIEMTINLDKGKPRLRCAASTMDRFVSVVKPHMIPDMLYKLPL
jgi:hypothetical protein